MTSHYTKTMSDIPYLNHPLRLLCLCPTYGRPRLVANTLSCFLAQEYPPQYCKLLIFDDANQYTAQSGPNWEIVSQFARCRSLPEKYHTMFALENLLHSDLRLCSSYDAVVLWDDDDIYLPNHLWHHSHQLQDHAWSYPKTVYKLDDPTQLRTENPEGNMWASIAFRVSTLRDVGFPRTREASFDLQFLGSLYKHSKPGRSPAKSFMFRWGSTRHPHQQNYIQGPFDTEQYDKFPQHDKTFVHKLEPLMDEETFYYQELYKLGRIGDPIERSDLAGPSLYYTAPRK